MKPLLSLLEEGDQMEWTRERRYRKIEEATKEEIMLLKEKVSASPWRQSFHIQPKTGLLNDPNGFSYYNGEYHLFYQWFPLGPVHGLKYWYHTKSTDLVHWENVGIGIEPTAYFDSHGAFSGTALEHEGLLYLFYTGNTRDADWVRRPYQCMATMDKTYKISKFPAPVIDHVPEGYTDHFRDPMLFKKQGQFYALIGAQREDKTGSLVIYKSIDLQSWNFHGELKTKLDTFGFMWECPGYLEMNGKGILIFSPQGLKPQGNHFQNLYQAGYLIGEPLDFEEKQFHHGKFQELDRGFDFYAPQVMKDPSGRNLCVGWMGLPEIEYPTDKHGWAHCLTIPRELILKGNQLLQKPVPELKKRRKEKVEKTFKLVNETQTFPDFKGAIYELLCEFDAGSAQVVGINIRENGTEKTVIKYDKAKQMIVLDRTSAGQPFAQEYGTVRKCSFQGEFVKFHIFVDQSSVEVFINDGEEVFTARIFPDEASTGIRFFSEGEASVSARKWNF